VNCSSNDFEFVKVSAARKLFRSAVLRIIKENREKRILDTPMIALMLKDIEKRQFIQNTNDLKKHLNSKGISLNP
jgi:hypothetical protein